MATYTAYRGDTFSLSLSFTLDAVAYDLTGATVWFTIKSTYAALLDTTALVQKSTGNGITNVSAPAGTAVLVASAADMNTLPVNRKLLYDIQIVDSTGKVYTTELGTITILPEVTRSVV